MNKFERELEKWNGGVLRGAQAKLAKSLQVSTATVALWSTGKRHPSKGYIAQMAHLFRLDQYSVMRLFNPAPYNEFTETATLLRENPDTDNTYNIDYNKSHMQPSKTNSISLPLLAGVPEDPRHLDKTDITDWWTIPLRYASGAQYLISANRLRLSPQTGGELYFIKPADDFLDGKVMLVYTPQGYTIQRICKQKGKITLYDDTARKQKTFAPNQLIPVGVAVRKISDVL